MQAEMRALLGPKSGHGGDELLSPDEMLGLGDGNQVSDHRISNANNLGLNIRGLPSAHSSASNHY